MSCLEALVRQRTAEGQQTLRKALASWLISGTVRSYLPQTWVLATDQESLAIHVDLDGTMTITEGTSLVRDGSVAISHDLLCHSIQEGVNPPQGSYQVTFYTEKGRAAFEHLARYFGL